MEKRLPAHDESHFHQTKRVYDVFNETEKPFNLSYEQRPTHIVFCPRIK